jgi:hypothetical protein
MRNLNLDIHTAVLTAFILSLAFAVLFSWTGVRVIRKARNLKFFRMRCTAWWVAGACLAAFVP